MNVALFIPCYVDQFYPDVAIATLEVLERYGCTVSFPKGQTCCGQPMANTGCSSDTAPVARHFVKTFVGHDAIVCPSGSCASMIRNHYGDYFDADDAEYLKVRDTTFELCEFLYDQLGIRQIDASFPHTVSLHSSCHGLRELRLGPCSEQRVERVNKVRDLLQSVDGLKIADLERVDECCGFGGTFSVNEADTSVAMGLSRVADHVRSGSEAIVAGDMSCLMHMSGLIRRRDVDLQVMHVAQIFAGRELPSSHR